MSLSVTFELSEKDLAYFKSVMQKTVNNSKQLDEKTILENARSLSYLVAENVPEFVAIRLEKLKSLVAMIEDKDWQIPAEEKADVLAALAYFSHESDLVPDHIPVLGFLDDAIMIELVADELTDDIDAYHDFCAYREREKDRAGESGVTTEDWLADKRRELHERMRSRRNSRRSSGLRFSSIF